MGIGNELRFDGGLCLRLRIRLRMLPANRPWGNCRQDSPDGSAGEEVPGRLSPCRTAASIGPEASSSMDLTSEQFDRILAAKGAQRVVQQVWSERPSRKAKTKRLPDRDGKYEDVPDE